MQIQNPIDQVRNWVQGEIEKAKIDAQILGLKGVIAALEEQVARLQKQRESM